MKQRYENWKKTPFSKEAINHLEHELKSCAGLNTQENQAKSLASELMSLLHQKSLIDNLLKLWHAAPDYFPEIINQLYLDSFQNRTIDFIALLKAMFVLTMGEGSKALISACASANISIAAALVKERLQDFFALASSMQIAVHKLLEKQDDREILNHLIESAKSQTKETFEQLVEYIYAKAIKNQAKAVEKHQLGLAKRQLILAVNYIKSYLEQTSNKYKRNFFEKLKQAIECDGLTVELLNEHLAKATSYDLFYSSVYYPAQTESAKLMTNLYKLAVPRSNLSDEKIQTLVTTKMTLPRNNITKFDKQAFLKEIITESLVYPGKIIGSETTNAIGEAITYHRSMLQFSQRVKARIQKRAEAFYQEELVKKGFETALQQNPPVFDPQGHVLVHARLDGENYANIVKKITGKTGTKADLEEILGASITDITLCNLDIAQKETFMQKFKEQLLGQYQTKNLQRAVVESYLASSARGSVIALQEELWMHISLSLRVIENILQQSLSISDREQLMCEINKVVLEKFRTILFGSLHEKDFDYVKINKELDAAREELIPHCRQFLIKALGSIMKNYQRSSILASLDKHKLLFTNTTATGLDYLRTDSSNETSVRISATKETAHNKGLGSEKQALRVLARTHYHSNQDTICPYFEDTTEARVPSIADKDAEHQKAVEDVVSKFSHSQGLLRKQVGGYDSPIIYNVLTSLHSRTYDTYLFGNRQRASIARILKGSHLYNHLQLKNLQKNLQLKKSEFFALLIYVQNIPVNQHTYELDENHLDPATAEATLMTDVALLTTLNHYAALFPPTLCRTLNRIHAAINKHYLSFLSQADDGNQYFKDSQQGKWTINKIAGQKKLWQQIQNMQPADNVQALVVQTLFKMFINNYYRKKEFGMLTQALSIFIEPISQAGCKSANERYQGIAGRVELLKSISEMIPEKRSKQVYNALINFVASKDCVTDLQKALDRAYNQHNLQGSAAVFSEEDQGASSKVMATTNKEERGTVKEYNTNYAESNYLTRLSQKNVANMQAHKIDLGNVFSELLNEPTVVFK